MDLRTCLARRRQATERWPVRDDVRDAPRAAVRRARKAFLQQREVRYAGEIVDVAGVELDGSLAVQQHVRAATCRLRADTGTAILVLHLDDLRIEMIVVRQRDVDEPHR